ncbi:hypothetical protein C5L14_23630 [Labrys okinawensis]|uniref:DUF2252 domain-containing protein n=1 Tax=Labrys okinawensis TaxID=346911 RepID=A0A2S9Q6H9_9HYPH|nr:DUF2252 family protein [Labrys okinawensis]PRH84951.1 hypothetical protein C5L14_23630 [Labrys okinawensis]
MNSIRTSVRAYENWLKAEIGADFVEGDLDEKHRKMRSSAFAFLRATYWRWAETILEICPELAEAPEVLAIGDTHLENFGTWRDSEGRLIWGANDFDDAASMPYVLDLVRLATSALLVRGRGDPPAREVCRAIADGYAAGLANPAPVVLERDHKWLRKAVLLPELERKAFWSKFDIRTRNPIRPDYERRLRASMPDPRSECRFAPRQAGTGSLGRARFVACGEWRGGPVLREAKRLTISAWSCRFDPKARAILAETIATGRCRAPDPHYGVKDDILVRRLSPNSRKLEVKTAADEFLSPRMLALMGHEIANCQADDPHRVPLLQADLRRRGKDWLCNAAEAAAEAMIGEQSEFA